MDRLKSLYSKCVSVNYVFYYISVLSMIFGKSLGLYSGNKEYALILVFSMLFLGLKLVFTRYSVKEFIFVAAIIAYSLIIYLTTGYYTFAISVLVVSGAKGVDAKELLKSMLFIKIVCLLVLFSASSLGIIANKVVDQYTDGMAYSFGYQSPNEFMQNIFMIVAIMFYVWFEKVNILHFAFSAYAFYGVYRVTNSKTGMLLGFCFLFAMLVVKIIDKLGKHGEKLKQIVTALTIPTSVLCFVGTMVASVKFDAGNKILFTIDQMITGRLRIQHQYWLNYGFSVFGKDISKAAMRFDGVQINNGFLDNNYWCSFYKYGFVTEAIFLAFLVLGSYYYYKKKEYNAVIIINLLCLYGLMEDFMINAFVNPFLIFIAAGLFAFSDILPKRGKKVEESSNNN